MFLLFCSVQKGQESKPGQSGQSSTDKSTEREQTKSLGAWMLVLYVVSIDKRQNAGK
jgi:hypothetical protein